MGEPPLSGLSPEAVEMNIYKLKAIMESIRKQGGIPTDGTGRKLSPEETLIWFDMDGLLTPLEKRQLKEELSALKEAEEFMERIELTIHR